MVMLKTKTDDGDMQGRIIVNRFFCFFLYIFIYVFIFIFILYLYIFIYLETFPVIIPKTIVVHTIGPSIMMIIMMMGLIIMDCDDVYEDDFP